MIYHAHVKNDIKKIIFGKTEKRAFLHLKVKKIHCNKKIVYNVKKREVQIQSITPHVLHVF